MAATDAQIGGQTKQKAERGEEKHGATPQPGGHFFIMKIPAPDILGFVALPARAWEAISSVRSEAALCPALQRGHTFGLRLLRVVHNPAFD
jgi:hypothetical protein